MRWLLFTILLACKGDPPSPPTATGSAEPTQQPVAKVNAPERPALPSPRPSLPGKPHDETFNAEGRDAQWASETEGGIKERFAKVRGGKLENAECRQTQCRLTIVGSEGDLAQAIADLEGARGLHGYAKNIILSAPAKKADGTLELRAFAQFER
jgi:hypothetical protein